MEKASAKRGRDRNWTTEEKESLKDVVSPYVDIIDSKLNNTSMIKKKAECWLKIAEEMKDIGLDLPLAKLKSQWMRMKTLARSNISNYKREVQATGGGVEPKEPDPLDYEIQELLPCDFTDDVAMFDSDAHFDTEVKLNSEKPITDSNQNNIPKALKKISVCNSQHVLKKRLQQIEEEMKHQDEIFEMRKQVLMKQMELLNFQIKNEQNKN